MMVEIFNILGYILIGISLIILSNIWFKKLLEIPKAIDIYKKDDYILSLILLINGIFFTQIGGT